MNRKIFSEKTAERTTEANRWTPNRIQEYSPYIDINKP